VTVFLEDYSGHDELRDALDRVPQLRDLLFDPYRNGVIDRGWPKAGDMVAANQRLLLISDRDDKRDLGVGFGQDLTVENYWSIGESAENYQCVSRWGNVPLDQTDANFQRLFVMNHFRDVAAMPLAAHDNGYSQLIDRLGNYCLPAAKRKPNYVAVDFVELGGGDAERIVYELDQSTVILFSDANFGGRAHILGPGQHRLSDLGIGNDVLSSLKASPGTRVTLYVDDDFQGASLTLDGSTAYVGDAFNDQASSLIVTSN
jgi:hypothetical protein